MLKKGRASSGSLGVFPEGLSQSHDTESLGFVTEEGDLCVTTGWWELGRCGDPRLDDAAQWGEAAEHQQCTRTHRGKWGAVPEPCRELRE